MNKQAYILFTRVPVPNKVKTRLQSRLTGTEASQVQLRMLQDSFEKFASLADQGIDLFLAYSDEGSPDSLIQLMPKSFKAFPQKGQTIGERMKQALATVFSLGYQKVILTGSDIPNLTAELIVSAFDQMSEVVLGPSPDGGYYLVGATEKVNVTPIFDAPITWGKSEVLTETLKLLSKYQVALLEPLEDMDHPADLQAIQSQLNQENAYFGDWLKENRGLFQ
ncbi:TIGR04282 family arsenosugar biosynthesis glycosyltransferase [Enterococcus devriesei]|uniref:TIGR04282 family arsenosugar biosynthesis glycosyltransferase n=1 Tax=Enterococcus devriesei TaxID=319970 RepID=UPI0036D2FC7A